ncbi:MAG: hypothetical protein V4666_08375 [Bacteroidota bacterium]
MKNTILTFLLGIFVAINFAATTSNLLTVKPAKPRLVLVFTDNDEEYLKDKIIIGVKAGYIVKSITVGGQYGTHCLAVMEKY